MSRRRWLRPLLVVNVLVVVLGVGYRIYLEFVAPEPDAIHTRQIERIHQSVVPDSTLRVALLGNINNSIGIFERRIVPLLNESDVDLVISAGNAVSDGGADKYRALRMSLARLDPPHIMAFGENEADGLGASRYYELFGPHFFSFRAGPARFIFLDPTGRTATSWQLRWLEEELRRDASVPTFVVTGRPILRPPDEPFFVDEEDYLGPPAFRVGLLELIDRHDVRGVIAAGLPIFDHQIRNGTHHLTTGGAGGLLVSDEVSFHHFVLLAVHPDGSIELAVERLNPEQSAALRTLESLWMWVHSLFFVGYLNFLLILSALILVAAKLHSLIYVDREYYPRYDTDPSPFQDRPLRVAMFTNNFLPFIGGVPISIDRLRRALGDLGHAVRIVAPDYERPAVPPGAGPESDTLRVPTFLAFGENRQIRLAHPLHRSTIRAVKEFGPDLIHVHHPFWLGSLGLWLAGRLGVPTIYTYHTRLEHYAHNVALPGRLFRNLISHFLVRRFANRCAGIIVPTLSAREYLRAIGVKRRILVQPTGVDCGTFRPPHPEGSQDLRSSLGLESEPVLVSVSRLSQEKNIDFMLEALGGLRDRIGPRFRFLLIGDGEDRHHLAARVDELGLDEVVIMPGAVPQSELPAYYHLADLFVFASTTETQGMVLLEAMATGLPVVAVRASGIDDLVRNGVNGYKTTEDPREWLARIAELLSDEAARRELGENARVMAQEHDLAHFGTAVSDFYVEVLASAEARRRRPAGRRSKRARSTEG